MLELSGKLMSFDLSGENRGRKYILCDINFLTLKKYFRANVYDVESQTGEQREPIARRVSYLKNVISNEQYTPDVFTASVNCSEQVLIEKGRVKVKLDENNPLPLLNGNHRAVALDQIGKDSETTKRKVENLPIPLMLLLDPDKRKSDFINLNLTQPVNSSQLMSMRLDQGLIDPKKVPYLKKARELALHLHKSETSPLYRMITFGGSISPLAFSAIASDRRGDLITSLFFSAKVLEVSSHSDEWFYQQISYVDNFIKKNTKCAEEGNLLCVNGAKGCSNLFLGVVNQWCYYNHLRSREKVKPADEKILKAALTELSEPVAGDLSSKRRKTLMRNFAQVLFESIANDTASPIGCHFGVPISLLILSSASSFGLENLPSVHAKRGRPAKEISLGKQAEPLVEELEEFKLAQSDTEEGFE